ncbi:hypothetical protein DY000_02056554 [Brassica cretica]|uniref:Uncharacterized protein n=1 Tax=Brassica cretica TaxID=69181 RepID=A0ABQ7AIT9_BRACR|nr:hypothetical protein DY000_02056554 [Brassica cretica]
MSSSTHLQFVTGSGSPLQIPPFQRPRVDPKRFSDYEQLMLLTNTNTDLSDIAGEVRDIKTIYNEETQSTQSLFHFVTSSEVKICGNSFLLVATLDIRGREYGISSLRPIYGNKKRKEGPGMSSSSFIGSQEQLQADQCQTEEQAAANAR